MKPFEEAVSTYGSSLTTKLSGPGEKEALLSGPVAKFIEEAGEIAGLTVVCHNEVSELDGTVRPDFGVRVNGLLTGHIELKAPGTSLDPDSYGKTTHNYRQWQRLKELPNLLHTNGQEWRLWRFGELVDEPVHLHAKEISQAGNNLKGPARFELIINSFLHWSPTPISSVGKLVDNLAPLSRMLREEVKLAISAERRAVKAGAPKEDQPFLGAARDWRFMLFPNSTDEEFADGYAQTVTFALLLAISDGIDLGKNTLNEVSQRLAHNHSMMGRALNILTEHVHNTPTWLAVEIITRVLSAVEWQDIEDGRNDVYLYLYEHFLAVYDPIKRKKTGSYYTPVEVVDGMVRLTEMVLEQYLNRPDGFRNPDVNVVDPALGTGTFPLSIIRRVSDSAKSKYGDGAGPEAVANVVTRIYGMEIQSGPYSVAELRISSAIRKMDADIPENGLNIYVADALEDPNTASKEQLSYSLQLIAKQRRDANKMKREKNIHVVIGNPPYKKGAGGRGGWVEKGGPGGDHAPLDDFRLPGNGRSEFVLANLYVFFWRWAFWKAFESTASPQTKDGGNGVVSFITATGYLAGRGFKGMREYIRRTCSHGWIINLTPEGQNPPAKNAIFNIETPVAIAIFTRTETTSEDIPADINYIEFAGTREAKYKELAKLSFSDPRWRSARTSWTAPFTPSALTEWDDHPEMSDLFPWTAPGVKPNRTWVYGPSRDILEERLRILVNEDNAEKKALLFRETDASNLAKKNKKALAGSDTEQDTAAAFAEITMVTDPKIVRVCYRSFDRQYLIADSRLMHRPSPELWEARIPGQLFILEQHSLHPKAGPGLSFSNLIPDMNAFKGSGGGRVLPALYGDGTPNLSSGLLNVLVDTLGSGITAGDFVAYIAGAVSHPGFVQRFDDELNTPGIRVPITARRELWDRAVELGSYVIWLHTYGQMGRHPEGISSVLAAELDGLLQPSYIKTIRGMPETVRYDADSCEFHLGSGTWSNVIPKVRDFCIGGSNVIDSWVGYRLSKPKGKKTSGLDFVNVTQWPADWSIEFSELLSVLTQLVALEDRQDELLDEINEGPVLTLEHLRGAGVSIPKSIKERKARRRLGDGLAESGKTLI